MVKIPHRPRGSNVKIPIPISPSIKRSIPRVPRKMDTSRLVVGSLNATAETRLNFSSSTFSSFCFMKTIFSAGRYFDLSSQQRTYPLFLFYLQNKYREKKMTRPGSTHNRGRECGGDDQKDIQTDKDR